MRCQHCKRVSILKCKYCQFDFCSGCIQLEVHGCKNLQDKVDELVDTLKSKLQPIKAAKI